jgi:TIR domain-containing protein
MFAARLYDLLRTRFGQRQVFVDTDLIAPGLDHSDAITEAVGSCDVLVVVIDPRWLTIKGPDGRPRLEGPRDAIRLEIRTALDRGLHVIPVLVRGASMPSPQELPEDLQPLASKVAVEIGDERWQQDTGRLFEALLRVKTDQPEMPARGGGPPASVAPAEPPLTAATPGGRPAATAPSASAPSRRGRGLFRLPGRRKRKGRSGPQPPPVLWPEPQEGPPSPAQPPPPPTPP